MRFSILAILMLAIVGLSASTLPANDLEIKVEDPGLLPGDQAPPLTVETFLKGKEFKEFEKGKVYIVECWATWCPPCLKSIPHLTELQQQHPEITVVGVAVGEPDIEVVENFVKEQGEKMEYTLAWEGYAGKGKKTEFDKNWTVPAAATTIPQSFIVDGTGHIAWMGSPFVMDQPLESILAGTWDVKKFRKEHLAVVRLDLEKMALDERLGELATDKDFDTMLALLDKYLAEKPVEFKLMCTIGKVRVLSGVPKFSKKLVPFLTEIFAVPKQDPEMVLNVANAAFDSNDAQELIQITAKWPKELKTAVLKAVDNEKVLEVSPYANVVLAKAQLITGDRQKAASTLKKYAETLTDPKQGKAKLQLMTMANDFAG